MAHHQARKVRPISLAVLLSRDDENFFENSVWRPLLESTYPAIDLSLCSTRLPFYVTSPAINTISPIDTSSRSTIDEVVRLLSKLSRILSSPFAPAAQELQHLSSELMESERSLAAGEHAITWKAMVLHGTLSIQSVGEGTSGIKVLEETEWAQRASESPFSFSARLRWLKPLITNKASLLDLVSQVTLSDQVDRLPILLYILQGAVMIALRLPSQSTSFLSRLEEMTDHLSNSFATQRFRPLTIPSNCPSPLRSTISLPRFERLPGLPTCIKPSNEE